MPTLLQINVTANWGSTGKIAEAIGLMAMKHGWKSVIAYGRYSNPSQSQLVKIGSRWDNMAHYLCQRVLDREGLGSRQATRRLIRQIAEIKPDIIHLHNIHDHYLNYQELFGYLNSVEIPVVWTFHDCWAFTGHCMHFVEAGCEKWKSLCHECPMTSVFPKALCDNARGNYLLKKSLFGEHKSLTIVPASYWLESFVKKSFFQSVNTRVIHNGIDLEVFRPNERKRGSRFTILAVSSVWNKSKGLPDICQLRTMLPQSDYQLVVVGLTSEQIKSLPVGIEGRLRTQHVAELVSLYQSADVLINPTYADTFPTVNLEALACGVPVITYRTGGSPEAIDEQTGVVVEQGDVEGLALTICKMREQPLSAAACRERAECYFDKNKCFGSYLELYNRLLNENSIRRSALLS